MFVGSEIDLVASRICTMSACFKDALGGSGWRYGVAWDAYHTTKHLYYLTAKTQRTKKPVLTISFG